MIKLRTNKEKRLSFDLDFTGAKNLPENVRLVCETKGHTFFFEGAYEGGKFTASIPKLEETVYSSLLNNNDVVKTKLEFVIDEKYFSPWSDTLKIVRPVSVNVKNVVEEKVEEDEGIIINNIIVEESDVDKKPVLEVKESEEEESEEEESEEKESKEEESDEDEKKEVKESAKPSSIAMAALAESITKSKKTFESKPLK